MYLVDGRLQGHKEFVVHDQDKGAAEASDHVGEVALQQKQSGKLGVKFDRKKQYPLDLAYFVTRHETVL